MSDQVCLLCGKDVLGSSEPRTCARCLGRTRSQLIEIEQLYAELPDEMFGRAGAASPMDQSGVRSDESNVPGGDVLVMLGPGSEGKAAALASLHGLDDSHAADDLDTDPPPVLAELASWEDDWHEVRKGLGFDETPPASKATIMTTVTWLTRRLSWAAQKHDAFDEFATTVRTLHGRLRAVLRKAEVDRGVSCLTCGEAIIRRYAAPAKCECGRRPTWQRPTYPDKATPEQRRQIREQNEIDNRRRLLEWEAQHSHCDQGGQNPNFECSSPACRRIYSPRDYLRAVAQKWEDEHRRREDQAS